MRNPVQTASDARVKKGLVPPQRHDASQPGAKACTRSANRVVVVVVAAAVGARLSGATGTVGGDASGRTGAATSAVMFTGADDTPTGSGKKAAGASADSATSLLAGSARKGSKVSHAAGAAPGKSWRTDQSGRPSEAR
jgi:hypothetical protein